MIKDGKSAKIRLLQWPKPGPDHQRVIGFNIDKFFPRFGVYVVNLGLLVISKLVCFHGHTLNKKIKSRIKILNIRQLSELFTESCKAVVLAQKCPFTFRL